jgi:5-methylcytosine-specific restriction endonuclease McrA
MSRISAAVRAQVRQRAGGRCEYCGKPDHFSPYSFHVDHIIPAKRHCGSDEPHNLAWACLECNSYKSGEIAGYEDGQLTPLYNPRTQK